MEVVWRKINGFDNYSVSNTGLIRNDNTNKLLKGGLNTGGYYIVGLCLNGTQTMKLVHRLVGIAYIENRDNKECIDHIDGNKSNNNINNLRWVTHQENQWNKNISSKNTSGIKGVSWYKRDKKWRATINLNTKIHLGYFDNIEDARLAIELKRNELHGIYANHG